MLFKSFSAALWTVALTSTLLVEHVSANDYLGSCKVLDFEGEQGGSFFPGFYISQLNEPGILVGLALTPNNAVTSPCAYRGGRIFDTANPPESFESLGSPNEKCADFYDEIQSGPGIGAAGKPEGEPGSKATENCFGPNPSDNIEVGNVLVVPTLAEGFECETVPGQKAWQTPLGVDPNGGTFEFTWPRPTNIGDVGIVNAGTCGIEYSEKRP